MTKFNSLVKALKKKNYQILGFHGNNRGFYPEV